MTDDLLPQRFYFGDRYTESVVNRVMREEFMSRFALPNGERADPDEFVDFGELGVHTLRLLAYRLVPTLGFGA